MKPPINADEPRKSEPRRREGAKVRKGKQRTKRNTAKRNCRVFIEALNFLILGFFALLCASAPLRL
jgi:RNase P protein component